MGNSIPPGVYQEDNELSNSRPVLGNDLAEYDRIRDDTRSGQIHEDNLVSNSATRTLYNYTDEHGVMYILDPKSEQASRLKKKMSWITENDKQPPETHELTQEERLTKRAKYVASIKATHGYQAYKASRERGEEVAIRAPGTPDAQDKTTSKRQWEEACRVWRNAIKQFETSPPESPPADVM